MKVRVWLSHSAGKARPLVGDGVPGGWEGAGPACPFPLEQAAVPAAIGTPAPARNRSADRRETGRRKPVTENSNGAVACGGREVRRYPPPRPVIIATSAAVRAVRRTSRACGSH
jgi:hypothetical protein